MMTVTAYTSSPNREMPAWFASEQQALLCAWHKGRPQVARCARLILWNPMELPRDSFMNVTFAERMRMLDRLKILGHDGVFFSRRCNWGVESLIYAVFCPMQIQWEHQSEDSGAPTALTKAAESE